MRSPAEAATTVGGRRRVGFVMGTAFSLDLRDHAVPPEAIDRAFDWLADVDARFSAHRADSEISRLADGRMSLVDASPDVREVLDLCEAIRVDSDGAFDAGRHRPDGALDPTGLVKGWAIQRAAGLLEAAGARNFCLNGGGDVVVRGTHDGRPWRVGVRHPLDPAAVALVLGVTDGAVATSGAYERGAHIVDPRSGRPATALLSATVVGPDLTLADPYATAAFVMGEAGVGWVAAHPAYDAVAVTADHRLVSSAGIEALRIRDGLRTVSSPGGTTVS